jgi:PAS domain S-box-containing protein
VLFTEDITARKHLDEMLRENEATIRALLETAAQAVLAIDTSGKIVIANRMVGEMFSYSPTELIGQQLEMLLPESLRGMHLNHRAGFLADPKPRAMGQGLDLWGRRKDGTEFPIEVSISSFQTARGLISVSFISDITRRKRAEEGLRKSEEQLRALAGSLLHAQEDERRRVARELHDGITQQLAFFSMELGKLASEMGCGMEEPCRKLRALQSQIMYSSNEVRRLSHGLHPSVITDYRLSIALEEYCEEFEKSHDVHIDIPGLVEDSCLEHESATCLYRIAQEGLRNAVLHGKANEIWVALCLDEKTMHLRVKDNGSGFDLDAPRSKTGLGLISMRERIRLVNGNLTLWSERGKGTEILASVPVARS